jgi:hypothetical protein
MGIEQNPIEFAMISVDFTESRNSLSSHGKWLRAFRDKLPPSAASIILQVQSQQ